MADTIEMQGAGWEASVLLHCTDDLTHATIEAWGDDVLRVVAGMKLIYELLTKHRQTFLRVPPEVEVVEDFESDLKTFRGYARLSFRYEAGDVTRTETDEIIRYAGLPKEDL